MELRPKSAGLQGLWPASISMARQQHYTHSIDGRPIKHFQKRSHPAAAELSVLASLLTLALSLTLELFTVGVPINYFPWRPGFPAGATPFVSILPRNTCRDSV